MGNGLNVGIIPKIAKGTLFEHFHNFEIRLHQMVRRDQAEWVDLRQRPAAIIYTFLWHAMDPKHFDF